MAVEGAGAPTPFIAAFAVLCVTSVLLLKPLRKLWQVGRDARQQQRFPPIGLAVIRDTRVRHGDAAQRQGKRLQDLAVLMAFFVVALPIAVGWLLVQLLP